MSWLVLHFAESLSFVRNCEAYPTIYELVNAEDLEQFLPMDQAIDDWPSWSNETLSPTSAVLNVANGTVIQSRKCDCSVWFWDHPERDFVYCPLSVTHCAAPGNRQDLNLYCVNVPKGRGFARNCMFIIAAWLVCIVIWLLFSAPGKCVISGVIATCTPYNHYLAQRIQRNDPPLAQHMMRRNLYYRRRELENSNNVEEHREMTAEFQAVSRLAIEEQQRFTNATMQQEQQQGVEVVAGEDKDRVVTSLRLKFYICEGDKSPQMSPLHLLRSNNPTESTEDCAICYQELEDGQRVSDLHCGHTYHVACLKEWCARRNVCPLCKATDICEPCYDEMEHKDDDED